MSASVSREATVTQRRERSFPTRYPSVPRIDRESRRLSVVADEVDDLGTAREFDESLLRPHQQLIGLRGFGAGLILRDSADRERSSLPAIAELAIPTVALLLNGCQWLAPPRSNATVTSAQQMQKECRRFLFCTPSCSRKYYRRQDLNLHGRFKPTRT